MFKNYQDFAISLSSVSQHTPTPTHTLAQICLTFKIKGSKTDLCTQWEMEMVGQIETVALKHVHYHM